MRLAANQGYIPAQVNLGLCYGNGVGVMQDLQEAARYYWLASNQGHSGVSSWRSYTSKRCPTVVVGGIESHR